MAETTNNSAIFDLSSLESELVCFICTEVLFQPLTLLDCLHTFCGSCLKEWFSHQHKKAIQSRSQTTSNPYTCPACRAPVKDARHDAKASNFLELFLTMHPTRGRTEDDKKEMMQIYKRGEDILPKIETRRRDRRERRQDEIAEADDRRMIEEARERSLRDMRNGQSSAGDRLDAPSSRHEQSRSRDREDRRRREHHDRAERRRRAEAAEAASASRNANGSSTAIDGANLSPSPTSPRHPDAVEARQRERTVAHQASLRSLISSSESGTGSSDSFSEARIMQEIIAEGFLDGINIDELTEAEQDELSERIAELYRQRHPPRGQRSPPLAPPPSNRESTAAVVASNTRSETSDRRWRQRSRDSQRTDDTSRPTTATTETQPRHRVSDAADSLLPPAQRSSHRRRASNETRRQTSPSRPSNRATSANAIQTSGTTSAIDLSNSQPGPTTPPVDRPRVLSDSRRTNTEPVQSSSRASELWGRQGADTNRSQVSSRRRTDSPSRPAQTDESPQFRVVGVESGSESSPRPPRSVPVELRSENLPTLASPELFSAAPSLPPPLPPTTQFEEPIISCERCSRPNIQYDVHRHCSQCNMNLCLSCYRTGRGCSHWFGFGKAAMVKFESSAPERSSKLLEPPHVLVGRQYVQPPRELIRKSQTGVITTTSDPADRLQEGHFCDRCGSFANSCFWSCEYCNEGEWGFCNDCVDSHHCCTHPLLPISHRAPESGSPSSQPPQDYDVRPSHATLTPSDASTVVGHTTPNHSRPSTSYSSINAQDELHDYYALKISANCDLCGQEIPPAHSRFHCPFHSSSTARHNLGGYDVCTMCYHNLVRSGRVRRDDGSAGWRKCPKGHRMIVIAFEEDMHGHQRRIVKHDLVGGWKCTEEDMAAWRPNSATSSTDPAQSPPLTGGRWSWREDSSGRRSTRARAPMLLAQQQALSAFPPDGGYGKRCYGAWSRYPEDGEEGKGELLFPKGGEVREVEDINGEWWDGIYCGERGVFPATYVREIQS